MRAIDLNLAPKEALLSLSGPALSLQQGRELYERHLKRPRVTGGVKASTVKRYRAVFDKFLPYATARGVTTWNSVTAGTLNDYAAHLEQRDYLHKTLVNELTVLKQTFKWLVANNHLPGLTPIELKVEKAESQRAYCYRHNEVAAMVEHCRECPDLSWLGNVIVALACTGLRIAELCSLRWSDVKLDTKRLTLTDESGRSARLQRRQIKSGRSRSFPIHNDLLPIFDGLRHADRYVLHGPRGGRLKPDTVRNILIREVIEPLAERFPGEEGEKSFRDGRLHSFRHYFCSTCANNGVPERMVMEWLGHQDSEMVHHYYHLHDDESRRRMDGLNFLGSAGGRSAGGSVVQQEEAPGQET